MDCCKQLGVLSSGKEGGKCLLKVSALGGNWRKTMGKLSCCQGGISLRISIFNNFFEFKASSMIFNDFSSPSIDFPFVKWHKHDSNTTKMLFCLSLPSTNHQFTCIINKNESKKAKRHRHCRYTFCYQSLSGRISNSFLKDSSWKLLLMSRKVW